MSFISRTFVCSVLAVTSVFAAWDGTAVLPKSVMEEGKEIYEITTPEELIGFRQMVDTTYSFINVRLKNDIVFGKDTLSLSEIPWIQNDLTHYQTYMESFDGQGHTIYGLKSDLPLFINVGTRGGVIKNLNIAHCEIGSDTVKVMGGLMVSHSGGVLENVEVRNCRIFSQGTTGGVAGFHSYNNSYASEMHHVRSVNNRISGSNKVGGVVGYAYAPLTNAFNSSEIVVDDSLVCSGFNAITYVGGIVGDYTPYESDDPSYTLDSVVNEGNITVKSCGNVDVGGIVGESYRSIVSGKNAGKISVEGNYHFATVGGIVGYMNKSWKTGFTAWNQGSKELYNFGSVKATSVDSVRVGGIVGDSRSGAFMGALNFGDVEGVSTAEFGVNYVGGVLGYVYNLDENALAYQVGNRGNVRSESNSDHYVGGVAGALVANGSYVMDLTYLQQAFNYGDVLAVSESAGDRYSRFEIGGIVGFDNFIKIQDMYNRGNVSVQIPERQYQYSGGLAGKAYYTNVEMNYGYNAGKVDGKLVGGLIACLNTIGGTKHLYQDTLVHDVELYSVIFENASNEVSELTGLHKSYTEYMQSDDFVSLLNTRDGSVEDQKIWTRRGDYPVFFFDTLMVYAPEQNPDDNPGVDPVDPGEDPVEPPLGIAQKYEPQKMDSKILLYSAGSKVQVLKKNGATERVYSILGRQIQKR